MRLADVQREMTRAMVDGEAEPALRAALFGGGDPTRRLAVHTRHYASSLARAIVERFAATAWLTGSDLIVDAARAFVREHPPTRPCIAEYGEDFPAFLGRRPRASALPYLEQFATIDWLLGQLALATDERAVEIEIDWSVDQLIGFYLSGGAPEHYELRQEHARLALRGSRGELWIQRI